MRISKVKSLYIIFLILINILVLYDNSYSYDAKCYPQYGEHYDTRFTNHIWNIYVNDKKVYLSSGNINDTLYYTPKGNDIFCYYNYPKGSDFDRMINEAQICLGKFENGVFPYEFYYSEHIEYGICILNDSKIGHVPNNDDSFILSNKAKENGFIALSFGPMKWEDALNWCKNKGGMLPEINNKDKVNLPWPSNGKNEEMKINGFKGKDINWAEIGLPNPATYWTGTLLYYTQLSDGKFVDTKSAYVVGGLGKTSISSELKNRLNRVACVKNN